MDSIVKQVIREYDKDLSKSKRELEEKKQRIYEKIPRLTEIEDKLNETGYKIAKAILLKEANSKILLNELRVTNQNLMEERSSLLAKYGYRGDFLDVKYKCSKCHDTGFINDVKCDCFKQKLINKYYDLSNLKDVLVKENFNNFNIEYYKDEPFENYNITPRKNMERIRKLAEFFVTNFDKSSDNLLLTGNTGLGKTFLCNCIAKAILDKGKLVLYLTATELFKIIEKQRFDKDKDEVKQSTDYIDFIYNVDLLIIDDLGTEVKSIVTASELLNIVNYRLLEKKPTIISTNLAQKDFREMYADRFTSRLVGHYDELAFYGEDIRLLKKYEKFTRK